MKYIDEFRDGDLAKGLAGVIAREADPAHRYHFMEFCGGHTHAISRYGVSDLLPRQVRQACHPLATQIVVGDRGAGDQRRATGFAICCRTTSG